VTAYYNEHDPFAAAWLRELIADGLIAPGVVDERSIEDVEPSDLGGFVQCHFFAGIGIWSLALRQAGWPDSEPIWTGSCPCQPFSAAGKGGGFDDERHLWPAFHWLIGQCGPELVAGEQVASKDGLAWLDLVQADMEAAGYAFGAVDTCAAGFGAPHIRQRLYWMADADCEAEIGRRVQRPVEGEGESGRTTRKRPSGFRTTGRLADAVPAGRPERRAIAGNGSASSSSSTERLAHHHHHQGLEGRSGEPERTAERAPRPGSVDSGLANSGRRVLQHQQRPEDDADAARPAQGEARQLERGGLGDRHRRVADSQRPGPLNGLWRAADWLCCTDGKWRPVAPGTFPLAPVGTVRNRVGALRGAGNAINLAQAVGFIEAVMDVRIARELLAA
jgi:DNA (cytosine-5)-methyltransferase 1